jgi:hypothetical protein
MTKKWSVTIRKLFNKKARLRKTRVEVRINKIIITKIIILE